MTAEKKSLLEYTYQQFMNEGLGMNNLSQLDELADPQIMGFGESKNRLMRSSSSLSDASRKTIWENFFKR